jgi:ATP-dependent RNA helicase DDX55/SPB4
MAYPHGYSHVAGTSNSSPLWYAQALEILVLDEADRLLDLGFTASINTLLGYLPKQRRTGLFSATQTKEVEALIRAGLRNPVRVAVRVETKQSGPAGAAAAPADFQAIPSTLTVFYMVSPADTKLAQLLAFMERTNTESPAKFIV